jgi:hypothetical protein
MHAGLFEALSNDGAAARLDDPGTYEELLFPILGVTHAWGIVFKVAQLFAEGLSTFGRAGQALAGLFDQSANVAHFQ